MKNKKSITLVVLSFLVFSLRIEASEELYFPPSLLSLDGEGIESADLSFFEKKGAQLPGQYEVDVYFNGQFKTKKVILFNLLKDCVDHEDMVIDESGLLPFLTMEQYADFGIKINEYSSDSVNIDDKCLILSNVIPQSFVKFNFQKMRLDISVPQIAVNPSVEDEVPMSNWDNGINAMFMNYRFDLNDLNNKGFTNRNLYLNLMSGLNIGAWRFRDNRNFVYSDNSSQENSKWQYLNSYIERPIFSLKSHLLMGDSVTKGDFFESTSFRGVTLSTDEGMFYGSKEGFAPVIRGTALTNAIVEVRQSGYLVYQMSVAPGDFLIEDLKPVSSNGDLVVSIKESTGEVKTMVVPFSTLPILLRKGRFSYSATFAKYRSIDVDDTPFFGEGTYKKGMTSRLTQYGGIQYSDSYFSGMLGVGLNLGSFGGISGDISHATSKFGNYDSQGQSIRFLYSRAFNSLGTNLQLAGYRYSTSGFYTFNEFRSVIGEPDINKTLGNKREQFQINISQQIGDIGSFYLSGTHEGYWNNDEKTTSWQMGFNGRLKGVNYNVTYNSYNYMRDGVNKTKQDGLFVSIILPITQFFSQRKIPIYSSYNVNKSTNNSATHRFNINGSLLDDGKLNWGLSESYSNEMKEFSSLNINYKGGYGNAQMGYGKGFDSTNKTLGASGGLVIHGDGLTFSQPLGANNILISAPKAKNVKVENSTGVKTDWQGYTIRPNATAYRWNRVALNIASLDDEMEVENSSVRVVPTAGAIVKANFAVKRGYKVLMNITKNGEAVPFGSRVKVGNETQIIGENGMVYFTGLESTSGEVSVSWGEENEQSCSAYFLFEKGVLPLNQIDIDCK